MWHDPIQYHARSSRRDQTALLDVAQGLDWSYGDWDGEIGRWSAWLKARGVGAGDRVVLLAANRAAHLSLFFACARLAAALVPLNYRLAPGEWAAQIAHVAPRVCLSDRQREGADWQILDEVVLPDTAVAAEPLPLETLLLILFTSGSTGLPKAVMLHAGMLLWNAYHTIADWGLQADDVTVLHTPLFHTGGWNVTALPLLRLGGKVLLLDGFEPGRVLALIASARVTVFFAVPTMFQMLAEHEAFARCDLSSLRLCLSGGAPLPRPLWQLFRERAVPIRQGFGLTEVGPNCFTMTAEEALTRPSSIGREMPHGHVLLLDEDEREVEVGQVGELVIAGPHLCQGYFGNRAAFEAALWQHGGRSYFRTGDLLQRDGEGFYHVVGRKKEMFISGGENIWPGEVERHLCEHPQVRDCRVVAVGHPKWGEVGFAFYQGGPVALAELRAFLEPRLARYKHPHHLARLDAFPLLANGKVDRRALAARAHDEVHGET